MKLGVALGSGVSVGEAVMVGVGVSVGMGEGSSVADGSGMRVLADSNGGTSRVGVGASLKSALSKGRLQAARLSSKTRITVIRFISR